MGGGQGGAGGGQGPCTAALDLNTGCRRSPPAGRPPATALIPSLACLAAMGVNGAPQNVRKQGVLRVVSMLSLLLTVVAAGAAASPRRSGEQGGDQIVEQLLLLCDPSAAEQQQAQCVQLLHQALQTCAPGLRGLVVVIDLSHVTVALDRCNPGAMKSKARRLARDRQCVRRTHKLIEAAAAAGACRVHVSSSVVGAAACMAGLHAGAVCQLAFCDVLCKSQCTAASSTHHSCYRLVPDLAGGA